MWNERLSSRQFLCTYHTMRDCSGCISRVLTWVLVKLVSSAVPLCWPLIFHPWQKLHDSMVLWKNWWTASSKMLINTLFYIAAFHFSPTNTALTLSVAPHSAAEVRAVLTSAIQFPPSPIQHKKDICENSLKWHSNIVSSCPCHFWSHQYGQSMKANKRMVNDFQRCAWPSNYTSACPRGNAPVLPEAKSARQNTYRIPDKCSHKELVFSIARCALTKMVFMCA